MTARRTVRSEHIAVATRNKTPRFPLAQWGVLCTPISLSDVAVPPSTPSAMQFDNATGVPRETISKSDRAPITLCGRCCGVGVYNERSTQRRVNAQLLSRFVAWRPLDSIMLAVSEKAPRRMPQGIPVTNPNPGTDDPCRVAGRVEASPGRALSCCSNGAVPPKWDGTATSSTDERNSCRGSPTESSGLATAGTASPGRASSIERASSIIPSNRPRTETPRRAASASTQARRS